MAFFRNSLERYGLISILFHWLVAVLILIMIAFGLYMTRIPMSPLKLKLFRWHKELGILILMIVSLRLAWRITSVIPVLNMLSPWENIAARSVHWLLYILMIVLPITGWLFSSAAAVPVSFYGLFTLPDLISPNEFLQHFFNGAHEYLAYTLIALVALHTLAALKHYFINHDTILQRMLWP